MTNNKGLVLCSSCGERQFFAEKKLRKKKPLRTENSGFFYCARKR
jgi:hypothetical protein